MFELMFFLALGRYVALCRKPLACAVGFTLVILVVQLLQAPFLVAIGYTLLTLPIAAATYFLLDRFEDQLPQWFTVAVVGGLLVSFGPSFALAKVKRPEAQAYDGKAFHLDYPGTWTLQERGDTIYLRAERGQSQAMIAIHADGKPSRPEGRPTTALGDKVGFIPSEPGKLEVNGLHHRYVYALTDDTLHIEAAVDGHDRALIDEVRAIEQSWRWKPGSVSKITDFR